MTVAAKAKKKKPASTKAKAKAKTTTPTPEREAAPRTSVRIDPASFLASAKNEVDAKGQRQGVWHTQVGKQLVSLTYVNDRRHGLYRAFDLTTGRLEQEGRFGAVPGGDDDDDIIRMCPPSRGSIEARLSNGRTTTITEGGAEEGEWTYFYDDDSESGFATAISNLRLGSLHGVCKEFSGGKLTQLAVQNMGLYDGPRWTWDDGGKAKCAIFERGMDVTTKKAELAAKIKKCAKGCDSYDFRDKAKKLLLKACGDDEDGINLLLYRLIEEGLLDPWAADEDLGQVLWALLDSRGAGATANGLLHLLRTLPAESISNLLWGSRGLHRLITFGAADHPEAFAPESLDAAKLPPHVRAHIDLALGQRSPTWATNDFQRFADHVADNWELELLTPRPNRYDEKKTIVFGRSDLIEENRRRNAKYEGEEEALSDPQVPLGLPPALVNMPGIRGDDYDDFFQRANADKAAWSRAIVKGILKKSSPFAVYAPLEDAVRIADRKEILALLDHARDDVFALHVLEARTDEPSELLRFAEHAAKKGDDRSSISAAIVATLRQGEAKKPIDPALVPHLFASGGSVDHYKRQLRNKWIRALRLIEDDSELVPRVKAIFNGEYCGFRGFAAAAARPKLFTKEARAYFEDFAKKTPVKDDECDGYEVHGLAAYGAFGGLDDIIEWHREASSNENPALTKLYERVIRRALWEMASRNFDSRYDREVAPPLGLFDASCDRFVSCTSYSPYRWSNDGRPVCTDILRALPIERAEAILEREIAPDKLPCTQAFEFVTSYSDDLIKKAYAILVEHRSKLRTDSQDGLRVMVSGGNWQRTQTFTKEAILRSNMDKHLINALCAEDIAEELGTTVTEESPFEAMTRLLAKVREATGGGGAPVVTAKISIFERRDEPATADDISRVAGNAPRGFTKETWPKFKRKPMEHCITLDLNAVPELRAFGSLAPYRALSLFVSRRDLNEAYERNTKETAVVLLREEDIGKGSYRPPRDDEDDEADDPGEKLIVHVLDVPVSVLQGGTTDDEKELASLIAAAPKVDNGPDWLQADPFEDDCWGTSEEDDDDDKDGNDDEAAMEESMSEGSFLFQFDERLVPSLNLGDGGRMYVFRDTAFWQCH